MYKKTNIAAVFFLFWILLFQAQENIVTQKGVPFSVQITVIDENNTLIKNGVTIYVNGLSYSIPDVQGRFVVNAKVDDEIRVTHPDFETVYYTLKSSEDIKILVKDYEQTKGVLRSKSRQDSYLIHIDSANFYKKIDIEKSISFIEKALVNQKNKRRNANTYQILASIYLHWKQYDLAEYNYKLSNQIQEATATKIAIATTQLRQKKYEESIQNFLALKKERLTDSEKIEVTEGLGDLYFAQKKLEASKRNYNEALSLAQKKSFSSKITDLNSKLAEVYAAEGDVNKAENLYKKTITLAEKESPERVLKEEEKVANFYNATNRFDDEIELRKRSLQRTKAKKNIDTLGIDENAITPQKINYKIGRAYLQKDDVKKAIPFLEESKETAKKKKDIIVAKDASRKISEAFASIGDEGNALKNYKEYVALVDTLYIKKEQEIQQVKRFSKRIAENQNRIASLEKDKALAESKINLAYVDQQLSEASNRKQRILIYSLFGGLLLISLLVYFMYRTNKQQQLANNLLALKSMRSQMNPHFIFNALNSVNSFIAVNDERNANRYLSEFSVLMRSVLENSDEDFIPLTKEIELLELYVKLEHNRFKDKFDYRITVDETIHLDLFSIPPMLLQPYIENAIWHGLRYKESKGILEISIHQKDDTTLSIEILDDGIGRKRSQELKTKNQLKQKSKGMSTIKNRIAILNDMYKERIKVSVSDAFDNEIGTKVELLLKKK